MSDTCATPFCPYPVHIKHVQLCGSCYNRWRRKRATFSTTPHGTVNGYKNCGCRCEECTAAHSACVRQERATRRGTLTPDDPRHGTYNGYLNYGCRCAACRAGNTEYSRRYNARRRAKEAS